MAIFAIMATLSYRTLDSVFRTREQLTDQTARLRDVALLFARLFYRMNLLTIGDFYKQRYGKGVEVLTSLAIVLSYLGWTSAQKWSASSTAEASPASGAPDSIWAQPPRATANRRTIRSAT